MLVEKVILQVHCNPHSTPLIHTKHAASPQMTLIQMHKLTTPFPPNSTSRAPSPAQTLVPQNTTGSDIPPVALTGGTRHISKDAEAAVVAVVAALGRLGM